MELKLERSSRSDFENSSFNRTFMELKWGKETLNDSTSTEF